MSGRRWKFLLLSATLLGAVIPASAIAQGTPTELDLLNEYSREGQAQEQVTSVTELQDVQPTDWAYEALRSLVERYGCIEGYPDRTYRGSRALTRYEFAAGLNSCLNAIERLIAGSGGISAEDLATLQRLAQEFEAELATLGARVDNLEGRVAYLEDNQFSTTTKLIGEVAIGISDAFKIDSDDEVLGDLFGLEVGGGDDAETVLHDRVRLDFVASFFGEDELHVRLDASNAGTFTNSLIRDGVTDQGAFTYTTLENDNNVEIGWLAYSFPIGERIEVYLPAAFPLWVDFVPSVSPYFDDFTGASGALSSLAESNPIYKIGLSSGGGIGLNVDLTDSLMLSGGYFGGDSFNPTEGNGLFNGEYSALGQITFTPSDRFQVALTYVNAYFNQFEADALDEAGNAVFDLGVGTINSRVPFGIAPGITAITNSYGAAASFQVSSRLVLNAWGGYTDADQLSGPTSEVLDARSAEIWYYGLGVALPDLGKEGNLLGLFGGVEPYVGGFDYPALHVEAFYKYQLNDNISITPGAIWIKAPYGIENADDVILGTIRTTFLF